MYMYIHISIYMEKHINKPSIHHVKLNRQIQCRAVPRSGVQHAHA